jgi:enoyl-CoA hydratase/carnithine racemase
VDQAGGIATVILGRPEKLCALLMETYRDLRAFFRHVQRGSAVRAVILSGSGRGFCSGGDMVEVVGLLARSGPAAHRRFCALQNSLAGEIRRSPLPVIAAVNGLAVGGGASLSLACDLRLASPGARFVFSYPGLSAGDMGTSWLLPRLVGLGRATDWLLTGRPIGAREALAAGLVFRIVTGKNLLGEARAEARRFCQAPRESLALTKRLLGESAGASFLEALRREAREQARLMARPDFREAAAAFAEKRSPRFSRERSRR